MSDRQHIVTMNRPSPSAHSSASDGRPSPLQRILVVDDSEPIRMLIADVLLAMGYTVTTACDGPTAMEELGRCGPQVVLMDIEMPGLDGCEVCRRIKSHPETRSIPVMLVSGRSDTPESAALAGADGFLRKPFLIDDLERAIRSLLPRKSTAPAQTATALNLEWSVWGGERLRGEEETCR